MRENPLGGKAGHAHPEVQTRADRDDAAANGSKHRERKNHPTSLQGSRDHGADVLPLAEGIRRFEDGPGEAVEGTGEGERQVETVGSGAVVGQADPEGYCGGKLLSPERRRCAVEHACEEYEVSERRACRVVKQWRGTQRYLPLRCTDEDQLTQAILALAAKYGRYGYRRITVLLRNAGWQGGKGSSAADLATRRAEGAAETAGARANVARGWFVHSAATGAGESCVELRLCESDDARWTGAAHPGGDRRVYEGVFGVAGGAALGGFAGVRKVGGCDVSAGDSGAHTFRQWAGVHCRGVAEVAG